jgi:uncharacterized RDD family membrane protein YckC
MSDLPRPSSLPVDDYSVQVGSNLRTPPVFTPGPAGVRYGGFWIRSVASAIDNVLLLLLCVLLGFLQGIVAPNVSYGTFRGQVVFQLVSFAISVFYYGSVQAKYQGTPGKRLLGLRLVRSDLAPIESSRCYARYFASVFSGLALGLGYLWAAFDSKKRTWHDRMAGTLVIRDP